MGLWTVTQQFTTTSQTSELFCPFVLTNLHTFFATLHEHGDEDEGCVTVLTVISSTTNFGGSSVCPKLSRILCVFGILLFRKSLIDAAVQFRRSDCNCLHGRHSGVLGGRKVDEKERQEATFLPRPSFFKTFVPKSHVFKNSLPRASLFHRLFSDQESGNACRVT